MTGRDLSSELSALLAGLQPAITVHFVDRPQLLAACQQRSSVAIDLGAGVPEVPEVIVFAFDELDARTLTWMRKVVANTRMPSFAIVTAPPSARSALRTLAQESGVLDVLLADELSVPVLEATIAHARSHAKLTTRLLELRDRFALAIRGAKDGMWEWDLVRSKVFYSQRWRELLNLRAEDIRPNLDTWLTRVHSQDVGPLRSDLESLMKGVTPVHEHEHRIRDAEGTWRWVLSRAVIHRNADGVAVRMAGSLTDITPYRAREIEIRQRSRHDKLTNLPDRRVFHERLARAVELAKAHDDFNFVVLLVDIDRLAQIRDSFGIHAADQVVALMAKRLRGCLRPEDLLFRYASDKFAILLEDVEDASSGTHVADRIHHVASDPFEVDRDKTFTTVSIGMTSSAHGYVRVEDVIADVSAATDSARDRGRNRHEIYDTSMRIEARTLLALEMALHRALDENQLTLHYQPICRSDTHEIISLEALMRWEHPERGRVPPSEFIPIAEDTGLIMAMGRWAIRHALHQLHGWREEFDLDYLSVSVNLSARQVVDPLLLETIDTALAETGLPPSALKLELTESVMMDRADQVLALLQDIRQRGVEIWIDDFGTGYSSLSYLHRFPVDGLKIDRSFVNQLDGTTETDTLVRTILGLAEHLNVEVIAEGIETEVQAEHLQRLGCLNCQGWYYSKPMADVDIPKMLRVDE